MAAVFVLVVSGIGYAAAEDLDHKTVEEVGSFGVLIAIDYMLILPAGSGSTETARCYSDAVAHSLTGIAFEQREGLATGDVGEARIFGLAQAAS